MHLQFGLPAAVKELDKDGKQTLSDAFSAGPSGTRHPA
jgi:hypothetical protein